MLIKSQSERETDERGGDIKTIVRSEEMNKNTQTESFYAKC